jgi:hypothetical protein
MISYCFECGVKLEYQASAKPKFCHGCGTPLGNPDLDSKGKAGPKEEKREPTQPPHQGSGQEIDDFENDENLRVPENLDHLEFELSFAENTTFKLGDILEQSVREAEASGQEANPLNIPAQKGKRTSQKKVVAQFKKEAGTLRQKRPKKN